MDIFDTAKYIRELQETNYDIDAAKKLANQRGLLIARSFAEWDPNRETWKQAATKEASRIIDDWFNFSLPVDPGYQNYATYTKSQSPSKQPIDTKVVGVTFEGRQSIVALLSVGEKVQLIRDPYNPHDRNAIKVVRQNGQCFGFISRSLAAGWASKFDNYRKPVEAVVTSITKGNSADSNIGVTIRFDLP
jgi:hypothetical protein